MNVFNYGGYKEFLKDYIKQNASRGIISQVAENCGCDRTYISQVLNGKADLTPDHIMQLCEGLGLGEEESGYLLLLLLKDRSASAKAKKNLDAKLARLKR